MLTWNGLQVGDVVDVDGEYNYYPRTRITKKVEDVSRISGMPAGPGFVGVDRDGDDFVFNIEDVNPESYQKYIFAEVNQPLNEMHPGDWDKPGVEKDPRRPWGTYAEKAETSFYDVIVMSPNGDSVLVDGLETYIQDVPSQLEYASGTAVDDKIGAALVAELERQEASGYIELGVEYKNGQWTW